jgi:uncharacterized membrane protein YfcA
MIIYSSLASTALYTIYGVLNWPFALWIGFWSALGCLCGLYIIGMFLKKFKRQSILVIVLTFVLCLSTLAVPIFGYLDLTKQVRKGIDIL